MRSRLNFQGDADGIFIRKGHTKIARLVYREVAQVYMVLIGIEQRAAAAEFLFSLFLLYIRADVRDSDAFELGIFSRHIKTRSSLRQ